MGDTPGLVYLGNTCDSSFPYLKTPANRKYISSMLKEPLSGCYDISKGKRLLPLSPF